MSLPSCREDDAFADLVLNCDAVQAQVGGSGGRGLPAGGQHGAGVLEHLAQEFR